MLLPAEGAQSGDAAEFFRLRGRGSLRRRSGARGGSAFVVGLRTKSEARALGYGQSLPNGQHSLGRSCLQCIVERRERMNTLD